MKRFISRAGIGLLILLVTVASTEAHGPGDNTSFRISGEAPIEIPFDVVNNHVLIDLRVNGEGPFRAVLDTGMPASGLLLYGSPRTDALDLDYAPIEAAVGGAGGNGKTFRADIALEESIQLPGLEIENTRVMVLEPIDFGEYHDGIIGYTLFDRFVVELDHDARILRLHEPEGFEPPEGATELPLRLRGNMPFVKVGVEFTDGTTTRADVVVDIGARHAISLNTDSSKKIRTPADSVEAQLGTGLSGPVMGKVGRIRRLDLGGATLENVITSFPVSDHQNPRGMDSMNGNLGNGALSRFRTFFDYAAKRMILAPARDRGPFEFDMSGLRLERENGSVTITRVRDASPGAVVGFRVDDVVTHIDGREVKPSDLQRIRALFRRHGK